jgi:NagD protein
MLVIEAQIKFTPELFLIDLDGVVYEDGKLLDGVLDAIDSLEKKEKKWVFLTNNSGASRLGLYNKLRAIGISCNPDQVFASGFMLADYIQSIYEYRNLPIYLIATPELRNYYQELGLQLTDDVTTGIVVVSLDFEFNYRKMEIASLSLQSGASLFVSNVDTNFPIPGGFRKPGLGAIVQAISTASGKQPDLIYGKPYPQMARAILDLYKFSEQQVIILGDTIESDIELGRRLGIKSALISKSLEVDDYTLSPDYYFHSMREAVHYFLDTRL